MKCAKKTLALLLAMVVLTGVLSSVPVEADEISLAIPKIKVKTIKDDTGVKITIGKTKGAEGYVVSITGTPANSEYCKYFKVKDTDAFDDTYVYMADEFWTTIEKNGKQKRSITYKNLQPGTYTVKVYSFNYDEEGNENWSDWSKEKTFTLKETAITGYLSSYDFSKVKIGDVIKFGAYEQDLDYTNGKEPIEWIVLKKTKKSVLLLSKYALDKLPYHKEWKDITRNNAITWETCSLRRWLNNDFIKSAFNKTEQGMIRKTIIENPVTYYDDFDSEEYSEDKENDTKDKVFLLSHIEMLDKKLGFMKDKNARDSNRRCTFAWGDGCWWWLRSTGGGYNRASCVSDAGCVEPYGKFVGGENGPIRCECDGVRPAMYLNLKS